MALYYYKNRMSKADRGQNQGLVSQTNPEKAQVKTKAGRDQTTVIHSKTKRRMQGGRVNNTQVKPIRAGRGQSITK